MRRQRTLAEARAEDREIRVQSAVRRNVRAGVAVGVASLGGSAVALTLLPGLWSLIGALAVLILCCFVARRLDEDWQEKQRAVRDKNVKA